ncbi:type I restriction endonuclease subunit S [Dehalococcoides mccartyi]|uniref:restriction endonuclease subunit S n=1 Tax=Dehalococcoides mccartyi TaxID=61435 RepID=UPI0009954100|nr:restriction endonuclease subunit S [Dehalococcoides mccartyi]AQW61919.1 type I restriction endonuclease subunit S [Dehalococcoides mccartyi]
MGLTKYRLGELVEQTFNVNTELLFGEEDVRGMTITKQIIPTKANVAGTELSKFLIVHPHEFVYNPRTHGKKIGLGYNNTDESFIISWNNTAFRIKPEAKVLVLPEYLFMHFNRTEWDREACYRSWGSSTEVFSWDALCEMTLDLPLLPIQQKYVDAYNAMIANQNTYSGGLDDLNLACDAYIEKLLVEAPKQPIGEYIAVCEEKNTNLQYSITDVKGVSIEKKFIETKANMSGVSLKPYLLVEPSSSCYVTVTSRNGEKISIAINDSNDTYIVSSSYVVFHVAKQGLLPAYLFMYLVRPEFDRFARFNSWGSARETLAWEDLCRFEIPIPDIEIQQDIVNIFNEHIARKKIADQLTELTKDICPVLIKGSLEEASA